MGANYINLVESLYEELELPRPVIIRCQSPWQMMLMPIVIGVFRLADVTSSRRKSIISSLLSELESQPARYLWKNLWQTFDEQMDALNPSDLAVFPGKLLELQPEHSKKYKLAELWDAGRIREHLSHRNPGYRFVPQPPIDIYGDSFTWWDSIENQMNAMMIEGLDRELARYLQKSIDRRMKALPQVFAWYYNQAATHPLELERLLNEAILSTYYTTLIQGCSAFLFYENYCLVCESPQLLERNGNGRLDCPDGPAVRFNDGYSIYALRGVLVGRDMIEDPNWLSTNRIMNQTNVEVRRLMVERFGADRFIRETAELIGSDDFGALYRKMLPGDEPLVYLEVVNSTAEEDGTFKRYFLRVPPTMRTAHDAVAWTFSMSKEEYSPSFES